MKSLPRSLAPLADESLAGFMLRLSHRLGLPPAYLERLTGLATRDHTRARSWLTISMPAAMPERFANATRLTVAETHQLLLQPTAGNYPPLRTPAAGTSRLRDTTAIAAQELWLFAKATRYCPQCLAGNGSPIQQTHGGPWKRHWRLPIIFACLRHDRLLEHLCPQCHTPALAHPRFLIPEPSQILHPAQCRARTDTGTLCQSRLDQARDPQTPSNKTVALQQKLMACLTAEGAAGKAAANAYLTDIRIIAWLISGSWPAAADLLPHTDLGAELDTYLHQHHEAIQERRRHKTRPAAYALHDQAPTPAAACAALLAIADHLYVNREKSATHLQHLAVNANFTGPWTGRLHAISTPPGTAIPAVLEPVLPKRRRPIKTQKTAHLRSRHIPQLLPVTWFEPHLPQFDSGDRLLRRLASLKLSIHADGHAHESAAYLLNIPISRSAKLFRDFWNWPAETRTEFDTGIALVAAHVDHQPLLTDYGKRRDALADWSIPTGDWKLIAPPSLHPKRPAHLKLATWFIWTEVTEGDHGLAPCLPPKGDQERNTLIRWRLLAIRPRQPHAYSPFAAILASARTYAQTLATTIDEASHGQLASKMAN